ncbi:MAG: DUF4491 family protein [Muribaculaceae bacterium]|nr:DUF4491 family protein [Muribaculaceae bacterium]MDE7110300.1 DUF4491 family protein [Muribaculaceae bacterium]
MDSIISLNWQGLLIGASTFLIIGLFHPLVIKGEYYFGLKVNLAFALLGIASSIGALIVSSMFWSAILAVIAFSSFWSIKEVYEQQERVRKGWFPANPRRIKR